MRMFCTFLLYVPHKHALLTQEAESGRVGEHLLHSGGPNPAWKPAAGSTLQPGTPETWAEPQALDAERERER